MVNKISIKIHNSYGTNSIKGEDITKEETMALIDVARELVAQNAPTTLMSTSYLEADPSLVEAVTPLKSFTPGRPTPKTPREVKMPMTTGPIKAVVKDDTPIDLGTTRNPDIKRIIPREPFKQEEELKVEPIEANAMVFSTSGSPAPINLLGDKLLEGFQTSMGVVVSEVPAVEFLSLEEQLAELNKDYHATGIKHKVYAGEITPMYRVRCDCPKCGNKGNHYILENRKDIACYECRASLLVEEAAGKFPERDEWGNFFIAQTLNPKFQRA